MYTRPKQHVIFRNLLCTNEWQEESLADKKKETNQNKNLYSTP